MSKVLDLPIVISPDFSAPFKKPVSPVNPKKGRFLSIYQRGAVDIVRNTRGSLFGTAKLAGKGLYRSGTSYNSGYVTYPNSSYLWGKGQFTVFLVVEFLEGAPAGSSSDHLLHKPFVVNPSSEPYYTFELKRDSTLFNSAIAFQINCGGTRYGASGSVAITPGRYAIVFAAESGRQVAEVYKETGELLERLSSSNSGSITNYSPAVYVGTSTRTTVTGHTEKVFELFGADNRSWSDEEMRAFGRNPFGYVLEPATPIFYMPTAAGGGGFTAYPYGQQHLDRQFAGIAAAKLGGVLQ